MFVEPTERFRAYLMKYVPPTVEQQAAQIEAARLRALDPEAAPVKEDFYTHFEPDRDLIAVRSAGNSIHPILLGEWCLFYTILSYHTFILFCLGLGLGSFLGRFSILLMSFII